MIPRPNSAPFTRPGNDGTAPVALLFTDPTRLAKRHDHRLGIGASPALECPLVVVSLFGRLNQAEEHGHAARRASSLTNGRWSRWVKSAGLGHFTVLCYTPVTGRSVVRAGAYSPITIAYPRDGDAGVGRNPGNPGKGFNPKNQTLVALAPPQSSSAQHYFVDWQ